MPTTVSDHVRGLVPGDVQSAMEKLGLTITRVDGEELYAHCPAHEALAGKPDRNPSFSVHATTGAFFCFSCHYGGSWLTLAADLLDVGRGEAVSWTQAQGTIGATRRRLDKLKEDPHAPVPVSRAALALFEPPSATMLEQRRLTAEAAADFGVLAELATESWILPLRLPDRQLIGWQVKRGKHVRNYPKNVVEKSATLFGAHLPPARILIVVESPLDAARMHSFDWSSIGEVGVRALFGSKASDRQIEMLCASSECVITMMDHDPAGWSGAKKLYAALRARGHRMLSVTYAGESRDVDPGDLPDEAIIRQVQHAVSPIRLRWSSC